MRLEVTEHSVVEIKQISAVLEPEMSSLATVFGLGTDGKVYEWSTRKKTWYIYESA